MPWYAQPARTWNDALPIGNGRLGAMVYGRPGTELLKLNEDSVWYGGPQDRTPYGAFNHLQELRTLIRQGRHVEAEALAEERFYSVPSSMRHYEPLATVKIEFGHDEAHCCDYKRSLDLDKAVARTEYVHDGILYEREMIASWPDEVLALRVRSGEQKKFAVRLSRLSEIEYETNEFFDSITEREGKISMSFTPGGQGSNRGCCVVGATCDAKGSIKVVNKSLVIDATETLIVFGAHTTFRHPDPEATAMKDVEMALQTGAGVLWDRHIETHSALYKSAQVTLGGDSHADDASFGPTDERLKQTPTPKLVELYHNFGRYLLLSSSRASAHFERALPANLQGIWNNSFSPSWGCKYTININIQMNYWGANTWNLSSCEDPLFDHLERMAERGVKSAKEIYGCRGWCAHHNTDIWADTDPEARWMPATLWPLGGAWFCLHIWERWSFTGDVEFLKRLFPLIEGAVQFCVDFLIEDKAGQYLIPVPSLSPENCFWADEAKTVQGRLCEGSAMDVQIIHSLFKAYTSAREVLDSRSCLPTPQQPLSTAELVSAAQSSLERLPPHRISPTHGSLQEWVEDYAEPEPGHRHFSHLFALFPGNSISPHSTPDLAEACRLTLRRRLEHGGAHTGWSRAWLINLYARLGDGEDCLEHLNLLLQKSTQPNLLDTHPPFQIDGNFGGSAGILEMLLQSFEEDIDEQGKKTSVIRLLPSCPKAWLSLGGKVRGLKCRGGLEISFAWKEGEITNCIVTNQLEAKAVIVLPSGRRLPVPESKGGHTIV